MSNYSQQLANAIAAMTKTTLGGMLAAAAPNAPRPRSVSEILDLGDTFVDGFPAHIEEAHDGKNN